MAFDHTPALYGALAGDATLVALLSTLGALPAIFMEETIPQAASAPYIWSPGMVSRAPLAMHMDGRDLPIVQADVTAITSVNLPAASVDAIADRVHALFFRNGARVGAAPTYTGGGYTLTETDVAAGPIIAPTDDSLRGRLVTVQLTFTITT